MLWPSFGANVMRLGKDADNYLQTVARSGSVISTNAIFFHVFFLNKELRKYSPLPTFKDEALSFCLLPSKTTRRGVTSKSP
jgi:hypothetical protein